MTLSTEKWRLSEYLERPLIGRRLSAAADVVVACWTVSNWPSTGDRRRGDVAASVSRRDTTRFSAHAARALIAD